MYKVPYSESDFDDEEDEKPAAPINNQPKFTYKEMVKSGAMESEEENGNLPLAV